MVGEQHEAFRSENHIVEPFDRVDYFESLFLSGGPSITKSLDRSRKEGMGFLIFVGREKFFVHMSSLG